MYIRRANIIIVYNAWKCIIYIMVKTVLIVGKKIRNRNCAQYYDYINTLRIHYWYPILEILKMPHFNLQRVIPRAKCQSRYYIRRYWSGLFYIDSSYKTVAVDTIGFRNSCVHRIYPQ